MTRSFHYFLAALGLALFCAVTAPGNHSEAEDAYIYARETETAGYGNGAHPHHVLYIPLMKTLYGGLRAAGYGGRAFPVLAAFSLVCAAGAVVLFFVLARRRLGMPGSAAAAASVALAACYGFWRYAAEAEIYLPAMLAALALFAVAFREPAGPGRGALAGALAALATGIHVFNLLAAGAVGTVLLWRRPLRRGFAAYAATYAVGLALIYGAAAVTAGLETVSTDPARDRSWAEGRLAPVTLVKAAAGFGQDVVSGNFLFAYPGFRERIVTLYPDRMLEEECYMGRKAPAWTMVLPPVTLAAFAACAVALLAGYRRRDRNERPAGPMPPEALAALLWLAAYALVGLRFQPGNPETWIMALAPAALAAAWLADRFLGWSARPRLAWTVAALLLAHNFAGGMALVASPDGDYNRQKAAWVLAKAGPDDRLVTGDGPVFVHYLQYVSPAPVEWLASPSGEALLANLPERWQKAPGATWAFAALFKPPAPLPRRYPVEYQRLATVAEVLRPHFEKARDDEFGGIYRLRDED